MIMTRRFLFVLGSARPDGNTELLARRAAEQLPQNVEQQWIDLAAHPLPDFEDLRHDSDHTRPTEGDVATLLDATLAATDIVIASPLYKQHFRLADGGCLEYPEQALPTWAVRLNGEQVEIA